MTTYNGMKINKSIKDSPDMNSLFKTSKISGIFNNFKKQDIINRPSSIDPFTSLASRSSNNRFFKDNQAEDQVKIKINIYILKG